MFLAKSALYRFTLLLCIAILASCDNKVHTDDDDTPPPPPVDCNAPEVIACCDQANKVDTSGVDFYMTSLADNDDSVLVTIASTVTDSKLALKEIKLTSEPNAHNQGRIAYSVHFEPSTDPNYDNHGMIMSTFIVHKNAYAHEVKVILISWPLPDGQQNGARRKKRGLMANEQLDM